MNQPLLSLCIPTNGVVDYVLPLVSNIYSQGLDYQLFEVVISDNGGKTELEDALRQIEKPNLKYIRSEAEGFMNQISCFRAANGLFLKMVNHKSKFYDNILEELIRLIEEYRDDCPMLFFSNGHVGESAIYDCPNLEVFLKKVSFWSSLEEGLGIWGKDKAQLNKIQYNKMFPAASILFGIRNDSRYVVYNKRISYHEFSKRIRRYDFFKVFAIDWIDIYYSLLESHRISSSLFHFLKKDLFRRYLISYYYKIVVAKTDLAEKPVNIKTNMCKYYTRWHYWWMVFYANTIMRIR